MTAMHEFVVPKSMPSTFAIKSLITLSPLNSKQCSATAWTDKSLVLQMIRGSCIIS